MTKETLQNLIDSTTNPEVIAMAKAELQKIELQEQASKGDALSQALLGLKDVVDSFKMSSPQGGGGLSSISKEEVEEMLKNYLAKSKISYDDLDIELRTKLAGQVKIQLALTTPTSQTLINSATLLEQFERPLFQKVLSDWKARNNVYLFGGAGTGKTYMANQIADFLGYEYIELNCNQFTSPLDILGGQTTEGYQKGKLEMAWENKDEKGNPMNGAVLCLDELPKIDPNTAGILNSALAKVKDFKEGKAPTIRNGRGETIKMGNIFIIATGNTKLNETNVEYEANFKQDLSLQDRFSGSTYEVTVDYENEFNVIMNGFAFIWIYMTKLREIIIRDKMTSWAFVSIRIMQSMRDTYIVFRDIEKQMVNKELTLVSPKTLKQALDSFLNLFKPNQIDILKRDSDYDAFMNIIDAKNKLPLNKLNTPQEIQTAQEMIQRNKDLMASKIA